MLTMNKWFTFFILIIVAVIACEKEKYLQRAEENSYNDIFLSITKATNNSNAFFVSESDLANYIKFKSIEGLSKSNKKITSIKPIRWNGDICLYLIQYNTGFEVISADKRSPIPLMYDSDNHFEGNRNEDRPIDLLLNTLAEDVWFSLYDNTKLDTPDSITSAKINSSILFWGLVNKEHKSIYKSAKKEVAFRDANPPDSIGHWELINISRENVVYDTLGHFVSTWWHQNSPFNEYSPMYSESNPTKCPAGCGAIAAAQILHFLHYKIGVPSESPTVGYCFGYVKPPALFGLYYFQVFGGYSDSTWDYMMPHTDPSGYAALLIGDVGKRLHTEYDLNGSTSYFSDFKDSVFNAFGINCSTYNYYNGAMLEDNLVDGYPVFCYGQRNQGDTLNVGHFFIVDRCIRYQTKYILTYSWVTEDPTTPPSIKITFSYSFPFVSLYQMNWGHGYYNNYNNTWCGMNGSWQYGSLNPYSINRKMICNFRPL